MPRIMSKLMLVSGVAVAWHLLAQAAAFSLAPLGARGSARKARKAGGPEQQRYLAGGKVSALRGGGARSRPEIPKVASQAIPVALAMIIPSIAIGSSIFQHFSPLKSVMQMMKDHNVGEQDSLPFVTLAFACGHWCLYGLLGYVLAGNASALVMVYANFLGTLLGLFYAAVFYKTCTDNMRLGKLRGYWKIVAAILATEGVIAVLLQSKAAALSLFGWGSTILSVGLVVAPLAELPTILRTRSVGSMPKDLILASLLTSTVWTFTGMTMNDPFVIGTNAVNIVVCCFNVALMAKFSGPPMVEPVAPGKPKKSRRAVPVQS